MNRKMTINSRLEFYILLIVLFVFVLGNCPLHAQKYSVFVLDPRRHWGKIFSDDDDVIKKTLDIIAQKGFNTIGLLVMPYFPPGAKKSDLDSPGYLGNGKLPDKYGGGKHRDSYKQLYRHILQHRGNFHLILRIVNNALHMINVDGVTKIVWEENDYFLRHGWCQVDPNRFGLCQEPSSSDPDYKDPVGTKWEKGIDFRWGDFRQRMLNFNNPTVRGLVKDIWREVIHDVVDAARALGKEDRILNFTFNSNPSLESEYWGEFFFGNDQANEFNSYFYEKANDEIDRINWIDEWQNDLRDLHGELSDLVARERLSAGPRFNFKFGAQWSGAYDKFGLKRGIFDLANVASRLKSGDWLNNADLPDMVRPEYNHNFSTDYYGSIGEWKNLVVSNETTYPDKIIADHGQQYVVSALKQQAIRSYKHGAKAFFVTSWGIDGFHDGEDEDLSNDLTNPAYNDLIETITTLFSASDSYAPERSQAIFIDPWAIYKTEMNQDETDFTRNAVANVYESIQSCYEKVSSKGDLAVQFITSPMLIDQPHILDGFQTIYLPSLNEVITTDAYDILIRPENIGKLCLQDPDIGSLDKFQQPQVPISELIASGIANDLVLQDIIVNDREEVNVVALNSITAGAGPQGIGYIIRPGGSATFVAGNTITLMSGFKATNGSSFHATICLLCDNFPSEVTVSSSQNSKLAYTGNTDADKRDAEGLSQGLSNTIEEPTPTEYSLSQNHPNPFNPETTIKYALKEDSRVELTIYNILGEKVRTLVDEQQPAGYKSVLWDGRNEHGVAVPSGIYIYRIRAGDFIKAHRMVLLK